MTERSSACGGRADAATPATFFLVAGLVLGFLEIAGLAPGFDVAMPQSVQGLALGVEPYEGQVEM